MNKKINYIYKSQDGEYFKSVEYKGQIVLSNPSYPFFFLFEVLEPLEEVGSADEFGKLVEKKDYQFIEGNALTVEVGSNGNLNVKKPNDTLLPLKREVSKKI